MGLPTSLGVIWVIFTFNLNSILVVPQQYRSNVHEEAVLKGNNAVMKCIIPSFVADFVTVDSWIADDGTAYFPGSDFGNFYFHFDAILVVPQQYRSNVNEEAVLKGNNAILKCLIPSFVADFVTVDSWIADDGTAYFSGSDFGKFFIFLRFACFSCSTELQN